MGNSEAYAKLKAEIDNSENLGNPVKYHEAAKLSYLTACCKEGMRLHPSVGLTLPRLVPTGGKEICGDFFPAGTRVGINAAVLHRDKTIFGSDADKFVPERWLRDNAKYMDGYMFQVRVLGLGASGHGC